VIVWVDAQLSPELAPWLTERFAIEAAHVRDLGLRDAEDPEIFSAARTADVVVLTKDQDFVRLLEQRGAPPRVLWLTIGNTSNRYLRGFLERALPKALQLLQEGETLVELREASG